MAMAPATSGCLACRLETPMPVDPQKALGNEVGSNSALIGNDGALKADTRISPRKWGAAQLRIRFLWSILPVPPSDNGCREVRRPANPAFRAVVQQKVTSRGERQMHRCAPYYCIARAGELWFERLDFDVF